jgi:hypothetical protein
MKHLTEEEISEIVHRWRAGGAAAAHLEQCRTCRQAVATHVMQSSLMKAANASRGGDHLDAKQIRDLYAASFEGEEMAAVQFVTGMWHLKSCDRCLMRFRGRHQDMTPSTGLLTAALATFWRGRPAVPIGTLIFGDLLRKAKLHFEPTPTGAAQGIVEVQSIQHPEMADSKASEGRGRKLVNLIGKPLKSLGQSLGRAVTSARVGERLQKLIRLRKGQAAHEPATAGATNPKVIQVRGLLLAVDIRQEEGRLVLEVQLVGQESGSPVAGATVVSIDPSGARTATSLTNEEGLSTVDLSSKPSAVRIELGIGHDPLELKLKGEEVK